MSCLHNKNLIFGSGDHTTSFNTTSWCCDCGAFRRRHDADWELPGQVVVEEAEVKVERSYNEIKAEKAHANIKKATEDSEAAVEKEEKVVKPEVDELLGSMPKKRGRPAKV